jgi:hypothetical protein
MAHYRRIGYQINVVKSRHIGISPPTFQVKTTTENVTARDTVIPFFNKIYIYNNNIIADTANCTGSTDHWCCSAKTLPHSRPWLIACCFPQYTGHSRFQSNTRLKCNDAQRPRTQLLARIQIPWLPRGKQQIGASSPRASCFTGGVSFSYRRQWRSPALLLEDLGNRHFYQTRSSGATKSPKEQVKVPWTLTVNHWSCS